MDWTLFWQITGPVLAVVVSFVLYIWSRREKVVVVNSEVYAEFLPKGTRVDTKLGMGPLLLKHPALSIETKCDLVLTSGQQETEVKSIEIRLDKKTSKKLKTYFRLPPRNRLDLFESNSNSPKGLLQPRKAMQFGAERLFDCTEEFKEEQEKIGSDSHPDFIQPLLDELETKYHICWTRYDGKKLCWKFPEKWWGNLGKKLWG